MRYGTNTDGRTPATDVELIVVEAADDNVEVKLVGVGNWKSNSDGIFLLSLSFNDLYMFVNGGSSSGCG